jgi:diguanylate cyclase (GGDEF)-like protein/PAS domain S-box-containing protein
MLKLDHAEVFQAVLENLQTGVYLVDRERRILFWNEGAQRLTGHLRQDVVGRFLRDHLMKAKGDDKDVDSDPEDPVNAAFRDGKSSITEVSILHKDGYRVPIVLRTVPVRNSHGEVIIAAESFDLNFSGPGRARRHALIAEKGGGDALAGVPSQTFMEAHLSETLAKFLERHSDFAILLIEVNGMDHFARTFGAGITPIILRVVAHAIENSLRPEDLMARWSGNRFLAVLDGCKEAEVERAGERIRKMIGNSEIEWWGDVFPVAAALGGAGARPGDTVEQLVERAEKSLVESIAAGGNRVTVRA